MTTTADPTPPADYLRSVRSCAVERKRSIYAWFDGAKFTSSVRPPVGPVARYWIASPSGTVRPYRDA